MHIEGLDEQPKPNIEQVGVFKLKDRAERNAIFLKLDKLGRSANDIDCIFIGKVQGCNNKIRIAIKWKEIDAVKI
jgi:hypothetical protein